MKQESETIKLSIKKRYAKQYYKMRKIAEKDDKRKKINIDYLTTEDVKKYAKSIGKW